MSYLDDLTYRTLIDGYDVVYPVRKTIKFLGATLLDDEVNDQTIVSTSDQLINITLDNVLTNSNDATNHKIINLAAPVYSADAATKGYVDTQTSTITSRQVIAGAGLSGGGTLTSDVTLNITNTDGSITINANDIQVGSITAAQHGTLYGQSLHQLADGVNAGFLSATHFTLLEALTSRQVIAGAGMTGGGVLASGNVTLDITNTDGSITINANDIQVGSITSAQHGTLYGQSLHQLADSVNAGFLSAEHFQILESISVSDGYISFNNNHSSLLGLDNDDHTQYLRVDGYRSMTNDLDMGSNLINNIDSLSFDLLSSGNYPISDEGVAFYDSTNHALVVFNDNTDVHQKIGRDLFVRVLNTTGSIISNGTCVYVNTAQAGIPTIALAIANDASKAKSIGLTVGAIGIDQTGYVCVHGVVPNINTSNYSAGDVLYVDGYTAGNLTNTAPAAPEYVWNIGVALDSTTLGSVYVNIQQPSTITTLHDVNIDTPTDGYYIVGNGSNWVSSNFSADVLAIAGDVKGSEYSTQYAIPIFSDSTGKSLTNSNVLIENYNDINTQNGSLQNISTITHADWLTLTVTSATTIIPFDGYQFVTLNGNNYEEVYIELKQPLGPGSFILEIKQGGTTPSYYYWLSDSTKTSIPIKGLNGSIAVGATTSSVALIQLIYSGSEWFAISTQPMQAV